MYGGLCHELGEIMVYIKWKYKGITTVVDKLPNLDQAVIAMAEHRANLGVGWLWISKRP